MSIKDLDRPLRGLDELAATIRTANQGVANAATNLIEHALAAGDALLAAKQKIPHGRWLAWLKRECDLSDDRAERYMRVARGRAVLEGNSARLRNLSLTGALQLLKPPTASSPSPRPSTGRTTTSPTSFDALAWWSSAPIKARRHFIDGVGLLELLAAVPPNWRNALEASLEHEVVSDPETVKQAAVSDPDGLDIPEILRRELPPPSVPKTANTRQMDNAASGKKVNAIAKAASLPAPQINPSPPVKVHDDLFRGYRKLSAGELEARVLAIRRAAAGGQHFSPAQWRTVDHMRERATELQRASALAMPLVQEVQHA